MELKEWITEWLTNFVKPTVKVRTYERYRQIARLILPKLGEYDLNDLSPIVLQRFVTELSTTGNQKTGKGFSDNTINSIVSVLKNSLKTAFTIGIAERYSADKIKRPRTTEKAIECFSLEEQKRIENAVLSAKKKKLFGIVLCLYSGLRIGELLALEWTDIDLENGILTISKSCHYGVDENGKTVRTVEAPKTDSSERVIPIPKKLLPLLKKHKKESSPTFVISNNGKPVSVRSYQRSFELLLKKLHISHRGFHALRHTFATRAIECGMDVKTLSEILGHKNPMITVKRYTHSLMEHKTEMMNRLGKYL